jgi:hypothetical protein
MTQLKLSTFVFLATEMACYHGTVLTEMACRELNVE